jgi:hypothetical protein
MSALLDGRGKPAMPLALLFLFVVAFASPLLAQAPSVLWTRTFGGTQHDCAYAVKQTADGGYIIVGESASFSAYGDPDVYLIKTDPEGNPVWTHSYGTSDSEMGYDVSLTRDGGYIVAGTFAC